MLPLSLGAEVLTHSQRRPPQRERKWRVGGGSCRPGMEEKLSSPRPTLGLWPAVPVYFVHSAVTRGVPKPPVLSLVLGGARISKCFRFRWGPGSSLTNTGLFVNGVD